MQDESTEGRKDGQGWTDEELQAAVEAYLSMQLDVQAGRPVVKAAVYRALASRFGRSEKSFELRMQNISHILASQGKDWLPGLKPAKHVGGEIAGRLGAMLSAADDRQAVVPSESMNGFAEGQAAYASTPPAGIQAPKSCTAVTSQYQRDERVKAWALRNAKGTCEACGAPAPFTGQDGAPYLEVHHIQALSEGGGDTPENTVALCPNCHRECHHGARAKELGARLARKAAERSRPVPPLTP